MEENEVFEGETSTTEISILDLVKAKTTVEKEDTIKTEIYATVGQDPISNEPKLVVYRKKYLEDQESIIKTVLEHFEQQIADPELKPADLAALLARKTTLQLELDQILSLKNSDSVKFTAIWRKPILRDLVSIDNRGIVEDPITEKQSIDTFESIKAKFDTLLISWDVQNSEGIVPIKNAMACDPDILRAFIAELDVKLNNYVIEKKK